MKDKTIILLLFTLPLPIMYWLAKDSQVEYDWILFDDGFKQKAIWYIWDSCYYLENIIKTYIIYILASQYLDRKESKITMVFVFLSVYRLIEYWLFHGGVPYIAVIGVVLAAALYIYSEK